MVTFWKKERPPEIERQIIANDPEHNAQYEYAVYHNTMVYMKHWRERLKDDPNKYEEFLQRDAQRARESRKNLTEEQRKTARDKTRERVRKYREKKKLSNTDDLHKTVCTRNDKKIQEDQRDKWRNDKQTQRNNMSSQKKRRLLEKRRRQYHEKKQLKVKPLFNFARKLSNNDKRSNDAERKALERARAGLPRSPKKFAMTVSNLINKASPQKRIALEEEGIGKTPQVTICKSIKEFMESMKNRRKEKDLILKRTLAKTIGLSNKYAKFKVGKLLGISRKSLQRDHIVRRKRNDGIRTDTKKKVLEFYEDSAITIPDMKKASSKTKRPATVLEETVLKLHERFISTYPESKISLSKFTKMKPSHIKLRNERKYRSCLCEYCQNIELKLKSVNSFAQKHNKTQCKIKDKYDLNKITLCDEENTKCVNRNCDQCGTISIEHHLEPLADKLTENIYWTRWENKTTVRENRGKQTKKVLITKTGTAEEMVNELMEESKSFSSHLFNAKWQHKQFKATRSNIGDSTVVQVLDFAENFTCLFQDEIQSAHWSHELVTVHPIINYYQCETCKKEPVTESVVFISNDLKHDFHAVNHFVEANHDHLKHTRGINVLHYIQWTDGCAGQYKSKGPFMDISSSISKLGCSMERNYFGSRHGKGPSDGESAVIKRVASDAVKSGKAVIENASALFRYCSQHLTKDKLDNAEDRCTHFRRTILWVEAGDVNRERADVASVTTLKGSRSLHAVKAVKPGEIATRLLSCYCQACISGSDTCTIEPWMRQTIPRRRGIVHANGTHDTVTHMDIHPRNADDAVAHMDIHPPNADDAVAHMDIQPPNADDAVAHMDIHPPNADDAVAHMDIHPPNADDAVVHMDIQPPNADDAVAHMDIQPPNTDDAVAHMEIHLPNADDAVAHMDIQPPNADDAVAHMDIHLPNADDAQDAVHGADDLLNACSCNLLGTIGNFGCDKATGLCRCKRYVVGRSCDQCYFGYWGLSAEQGGCRACDCDIGGALSEECDQQSGQCQCRNNIIGLKCKTVRPGFFYAGLDHNLYEAESSRGIGNARIYIREPYPDSPSSWTGRGFMKIMEGDSIEFTVDHIPLSMNYNLVLRYDPRMPEPWEDVRVTVVRRSRVDSEGACANSIPQDDFKATTIQPGSRYTIVSPQSCLEKGQTYTIRVDFNRYRSDLVTPEATLLIDSLLVVPHTESIPIFQGPREPEYMLRDFIRYRCRDMMMPTVQQELPDRCKRHIFSISAVLHDMALPCECDPIGSVNADCEEFAGQCECQPNVVGRRCDQCAPGTYGFGPQGCSPCNCNAVGSRDNFCNEQTGQCLCAPNTYGRMCDECQRGFWGFPNCRQCECNGHAEICDNQSGRCIDCTNFTIGSFCESCLDGYYGDPRDRIQIPCQPCLCPGGPGSTVQHADTCVLDPRVARVVCNCQPNYRGIHCDECAENFYGDPISPGGSCESCICNNNVNLDAPGNCDADSGECLQCLYDTEGFSCEKCAPGFFGDATMQNCQRCVCHELGTDPQLIDCDRVTGHCHCLPNVIGERCDRCDLYFWNLTSGTGCESCACDPQGSMSPECNMFDGQCECRAGRGGRTCGDCENIYWGDPRDQCYPCDCNIQGSATMQCDRHTGQCICLVGISGYKCDRCDRGTTGELPNCVPCGECFDNWDRVIRDLTSQTRYIVDEAHKIKDVGASRAFDKEFQQMEENIDEIRAIIANSSISSIQVAELEELLVQIRQNLTANLAHLDDIDKDLQDSTSRVQTGTNRISSLKFRVEDLKALAQELRKNATQVKSQEIEGAFNITREAQMRSQAAQDKVDSSEQIVGLSQQTRQEVEDLMAKGEAEFNRKVQANDQDLMEIDRDVMSLNGRIVDINQMVCDGTGDPCDALCGGGGCSSCGGPSCDNGAVTKANNALDLARKAEELLKVKEGEAQSILTDINVAKRDADEAKDEAQLAYESALVAKNHSETARSDLEDLLIRIQDFLSQSGASPADIRQLAQEVLGMSISLTPDQIRTLAQQINETISGLQNIDSILNDTKDDLDLAQRLKDRADNASRNAAAILGTAEQVLQALSGAKVAQDAADQAIKQANSDITDAEGDLTMIESETAAAAEKANKSLNSVTVLKASLAGLRKKYTENDLKVKQAETEAEEAARLADVAGRDANDLDSKYQSASDQLNSKFNMTSDARERAKNLRERANKIAADTFSKLQRLQDMQKDYEQNEKTLVDLSQEIDDLNKRMSDYLLVIQEKAKDYRDCQPD